MDEPYQEKHGAFLLRCAPTRDSEGRFVPKLIATRLDRTGHQDIHLELPVSRPFELASMAAEFALGFGKRWVRERILPPSVDTTY